MRYAPAIIFDSTLWQAVLTIKPISCQQAHAREVQGELPALALGETYPWDRGMSTARIDGHSGRLIQLATIRTNALR